MNGVIYLWLMLYQPIWLQTVFIILVPVALLPVGVFLRFLSSVFVGPAMAEAKFNTVVYW